MASTSGHPQDQWDSCQQGEIRNLVGRLKSRRRAQAIQKGTLAAAVVLMAVFVGYYVFGVRPYSEPDYGGIVCSRVRQLAPQYMAGDVDVPEATRIKRHLELCPHCQQWMKEQMPEAAGRSGSVRQPAPVAATGSGRLLALLPQERL